MTFIHDQIPTPSSQENHEGHEAIEGHEDGRGVAYVNSQDGSNIWLQPIDGSAATRLTHFTDGKRMARFAWSSDFARLAILRESTRTNIGLYKGIKAQTGRN